VNEVLTKVQTIQSSLQAADTWEEKGEATWIGRCLSTALMGYISIAVEDFEDGDLAAEWLVREGVPSLLSRHLNATTRLAAEVDAKKLPSSTLGGNYYYLVFSHLSWLLMAWEQGESYVIVATRPDVFETSTQFWREYAKGMNLLVHRQQYRMTELHLRGQENYWVAYLRLFQAASSDNGLDDALADVDKSFAMRNNDKSITDDSYEIEGSGEHPVKLNFRRLGLVNYIQARIK
jgi:hypothetical protein